ncbi:hypothetical protein HPB48_003509 [Haemaphysalis longicornis]|uniref:Uncharacterized protein n=1 Tax=Haemaphysalis longicornis TaxID=44386 RepID=A0A9J6GWI3_HAELO|nr:hypothetical protein HPB48_003509 [Haemaphysalis longicornis]
MRSSVCKEIFLLFCAFGHRHYRPQAYGSLRFHRARDIPVGFISLELGADPSAGRTSRLVPSHLLRW